jgi:catalase
MDAMSSNLHPIQAVQEAMGAAGADPRPMQRTSLFNNANDGPAKIIAKVSGVQSGGKRVDDGPYFTNNEGIPFPDPNHTKSVGGLPLVSDTFLLQKQQTFNRSKTLSSKQRCPRNALFMSNKNTGMVHPCGSGAFGYFETTKDMSQYTKANFLSGKGVKTPIFMRLSTVTLGRQYPDSARNPRGFAIKFYTGEGNYDLVGLNWVSCSGDPSTQRRKETTPSSRWEPPPHVKSAIRQLDANSQTVAHFFLP